MTAKYCIALIEDDDLVRDAIERILAIWGHDIVSGPSSESVLAPLEAQGRSPDLIIADYRLADQKTGIGAITSMIQGLGKTIPAVVITGDTTQAVRKEIETAGYEVLYKPTFPDDMRRLLDRLLPPQ